ncbi:hypothetical protein [uncultured Mucilaginibacter sp.]|uniref:hypothetical protein n=1 Tax=uncultured Mucilaginibacter sp. TaxID=797541 RepID=UPI002603BF17|nr:hypothetical protein [uncultured Mucilaginibacter sp.]
MTNGVFEAGERVMTKDGEGKVNKSQEKKEDHIEVKLDTGEIKTYPPAEVSDDADAG